MGLDHLSKNKNKKKKTKRRKNNMKKILIMLLCLMLAASSLMACVSSDEIVGEQGDSKKLNLRVSHYDGGIGHAWLDAAVTRYEKMHENDTFSGGKVGIDIVVDNNKNDTAPTINLTNFDVVIDEERNFIDIASQGHLLDISDVVTDTSKGESIESRLTEEQKSWYKAINGKYYVIPHYEYFGGLSYDINTFEDYKLYFSKNSDNGNNGFIITDTEEKSVGLDGVPNTSDDGLPTSYEEFYSLMEQMKKVGVTPFVWTGQYKFYVNLLLNGLVGSYCGIDELKVLTDFTGKDVRLVTGFEGNEPIVEQKDVEMKTGYYARQLAGKYYALSFLEKIMSDPNNYYERSMLTAFSNIDAQKVFIDAYARRGVDGQKPIGFLIEGNYWYNEAKDANAFEMLEKYGMSEEERKLGWMPLPSVVSKGEAAKSSKPTLLSTGSAIMMINGNIADDAEKVKVAKDFLAYLNLEEQLQEFTAITGVTKGLMYQLTETQYQSMGEYAKSVWDLRKNANIFYPFGDGDIFVNNVAAFSVNTNESFWESNIGGSYSTMPVDKMLGGVTAKEYFEGMKTAPVSWERAYGKYFNI